MDSLWQEDEIDIALKVVIVGDGGVGKSSLIRRYCQGVFTSAYKKTIGVDFLERVVNTGNGEQVRLMIWDTAGQEEFDAITRAYYRGSHFCLLAFSTTDRESFENVRWWKEKVENECGPVPMVLVMNKIDLIANSVIGRHEAEEMASSLGLVLYTTSSKENVNVESVFQDLAQRFSKTQDKEAEQIIPSCQVGGWRGIAMHHQRHPLHHHQQQQRIQLQMQLRKQNQRIQGRAGSENRDNTPRAVQRQESQKMMNIQNYERFFGADLHDSIDEMWEDPLYSDLQSTQLNSFQHRPCNTRQMQTIKQNPLQHESLKLEHEEYFSSKFSTPASSLVYSQMGQSRMLLDSRLSISGRDEEEDFATQFLESPMFDSLKWKRSWGARKKGKYSLYGSSGGLANKCAIM